MENYKQIKSDLDQLRSIVEKSELWVYKRQGPDEGMDAGEVLSTEPEHNKVKYIIHQKNQTTLRYLTYKSLFFDKLFQFFCRGPQGTQTNQRKQKVQAVTTTEW